MSEGEIWRLSLILFRETVWNFLNVVPCDPLLPTGLQMPFYSVLSHKHHPQALSLTVRKSDQ